MKKVVQWTCHRAQKTGTPNGSTPDNEVILSSLMDGIKLIAEGVNLYNRSGCTLFAKILSQTNAYHYYSLSTPIHEIANSRKKDGSIERITQKHLQDIGNELRREHGSHYLSLKTIEAIDQNCNKGEKIR